LLFQVLQAHAHHQLRQSGERRGGGRGWSPSSCQGSKVDRVGKALRCLTAALLLLLVGRTSAYSQTAKPPIGWKASQK
jgi:hypothetical protein